MSRALVSFFVLLSTLSGFNSFAQGTVFAYQGRLNDGAAPATGTYDFTYTLYDSTNQPGNVVAGTITNLSIPVANGLFTVNLDFGDVFNGTALWLQIGVRTNGATGFVPLTPRQPVAPVPYALFARSATNLVGALSPQNIAPLTSLITSSSNGLYSSLNSAWTTNLASATTSGLATSNMFLQSQWFPDQQESISRLPPLGIAGWFGAFDGSSWTNHESVVAISNALYNANATLYPFGYRYLQLDDGWSTTNLDANNLAQMSPSMQVTFGSGTAGVSNFIYAIHTNGWKIGLYADGGTDLSSAHFQHGLGGYLLWTNIATLGRYGLDALKTDQILYDKERIAAIIAQNGYPIYLHGSTFAGYGLSSDIPLPLVWSSLLNGFRSVSGGDVTSYAQLLRWTDSAMTNNWWAWVRPGHFIDMDYIGGEAFDGGGFPATKTHFIICALFSSPIWDDASFAPGSTMNLFATNTAMLAIDQDPAVICAQRYLQTNNCDVYVKPLGSPNGPQYALGIVNRSSTTSETVSVAFKDLPPLFSSGVPNWSAYDCVSNAGWVLQGADTFTMTLGTNDSILWRLTPAYALATNIIDVNYPDSVVLNVVSNGMPYTFYSRWDPDASNYIARAGLTNRAEILAAAEAVCLGKQHGWWNNLDALYLFRGSTSDSSAQNLLSTNYEIIWHGGVTFDWNGVTGDGSTGYGDTQFNPSMAGNPKWSLNSASLFLYNMITTPNSSRPMGAASSSFRSDLSWDGVSTMTVGGINTGNAFTMADNTGVDGSSGFASGAWLVSRTGGSTQALYHNNILAATDTSFPATTVPLQNFYLLAEDSNGLLKPSTMNLSWAGFGTGMTQSQWSAFQSDMRTVMSILGL